MQCRVQHWLSVVEHKAKKAQKPRVSQFCELKNCVQDWKKLSGTWTVKPMWMEGIKVLVCNYCEKENPDIRPCGKCQLCEAVFLDHHDIYLVCKTKHNQHRKNKELTLSSPEVVGGLCPKCLNHVVYDCSNQISTISSMPSDGTSFR